jgi:hypothetical protein
MKSDGKGSRKGGGEGKEERERIRMKIRQEANSTDSRGGIVVE